MNIIYRLISIAKAREGFYCGSAAALMISKWWENNGTSYCSPKRFFCVQKEAMMTIINKIIISLPGKRLF
jgi:hypothetical protein